MAPMRASVCGQGHAGVDGKTSGNLERQLPSWPGPVGITSWSLEGGSVEPSRSLEGWSDLVKIGGGARGRIWKTSRGG